MDKKIKADVLENAPDDKTKGTHSLMSASKFSLSQVFRNINSADKHFLNMFLTVFVKNTGVRSQYFTTFAQKIKEVIFTHEKLGNSDRRETSCCLGIYETYLGQGVVRGYDREDFGYSSQSAERYARLPEGFSSYGYTGEQQNGRGIFAEDGSNGKIKFSKETAAEEETEENKKAPIWFTSRGLQLPKLVQTIIDANTKIAQNPTGVNNQYMQNLKKESDKTCRLTDRHI